MSSTTVRIPATSANLGPGYDTMGIALQLYNTMTLARVTGRKAAVESHEMVEAAAEAYFRAARKRAFRFSWSIAGEVPRSRGLGSSVTVRLGVLHGLNDLCGSPLDREEIYEICATLEGHPDNAAPAAFGGFTIAAAGMPLQRYRVDTSLEIVLLIPDLEVLTEDARKVLPKSIPLGDAVRSAGQAAAIAGAFASRDYSLLAGGFRDNFHQPSRLRFVPFLNDVIEAGIAAGALGGWLSGSGSAIACATLDEPERVAAAMLSASAQQHATAFSTRVDNAGVRISRR